MEDDGDMLRMCLTRQEQRRHAAAMHALAATSGQNLANLSGDVGSRHHSQVMIIIMHLAGPLAALAGPLAASRPARLSHPPSSLPSVFLSRLTSARCLGTFSAEGGLAASPAGVSRPCCPTPGEQRWTGAARWRGRKGALRYPEPCTLAPPSLPWKVRKRRGKGVEEGRRGAAALEITL